jgi:hypothetical protein
MEIVRVTASVGELDGANAMRAVLAFGLLITLCASSEAATVHRARPPARHVRPVYERPIPHATAPQGFAVPGWTDEQTRYWLDSATGPKD